MASDTPTAPSAEDENPLVDVKHYGAASKGVKSGMSAGVADGLSEVMAIGGVQPQQMNHGIENRKVLVEESAGNKGGKNFKFFS